MTVDLEFLQSVPYFSGLSPNDLETIGQSCLEKRAERDEMIMMEGERSDALYTVVSGVVKLFKTSAEGKEQILRLARPGESLNDVSVFDGGTNPTSAQAMGPVVICGISKNDLDAIIKDHPQVTSNVNRTLAGRIRQLMSLVEDLSFRHVVDRVAKILLEHTDDGASAPPRLTQREMAALAGTAREVIGRSLKALEQAGAIKMDRHRIVVLDRAALRDMAGISAPGKEPARPVG